MVDTNMLLRLEDSASPFQDQAIKSLERLQHFGTMLCIMPQNLIEFWAVATRPLSVNGLELTPTEAAERIDVFLSLFQFLPDTAGIYYEWARLVQRYGVSGKQAHDARLVAVMRTHGIAHLLTFNVNDFNRYRDIIVPVHPQSVTP